MRLKEKRRKTDPNFEQTEITTNKSMFIALLTFLNDRLEISGAIVLELFQSFILKIVQDSIT
jgi:hypothetical protein